MNKFRNFIRRSLQSFLRVLTRIFLIDVISDPSARPILIWAGTLVVFGTLVFSWLEGWSYLDAFYFSVVTLATVGYGDYAPKTDFGKFLDVFFILNGLGVLLALLNTITEIRRKKVLQLEEQRLQRVGEKAKAVETTIEDNAVR
jgi:voltage-gated potassium channel